MDGARYMSGGSIAAMQRRLGVKFSGIFTTSSGSSPVTSATRTCTAGGTLLFNNVNEFSDLEYNKNSAGWVDVVGGGTLAMSVGDTLAFRDTIPSAPDQALFDLRNNDLADLIEAVFLVKA